MERIEWIWLDISSDFLPDCLRSAGLVECSSISGKSERQDVESIELDSFADWSDANFQAASLGRREGTRTSRHLLIAIATSSKWQPPWFRNSGIDPSWRASTTRIAICVPWTFVSVNLLRLPPPTPSSDSLWNPISAPIYRTISKPSSNSDANTKREGKKEKKKRPELIHHPDARVANLFQTEKEEKNLHQLNSMKHDASWWLIVEIIPNETRSLLKIVFFPKEK